MRNAGMNGFAFPGTLFLMGMLFLLFAVPAQAVVDFNWTSLFKLVGSAGAQKDVPDEITVFEDPPPGDGVTIDYDFLGMGMLVTKKQLEAKKKDHQPFDETIDYFNSIVGGGKILFEPDNLKAFLNSHIGMAKYGFMSKKEYDKLIAEGKKPTPPPKRGGGLAMPIEVKGDELETPGERKYEAYSMADKGWKVVQPLSDIMGTLNGLKHQACDDCKKCLGECPNCYTEEVPDPTPMDPCHTKTVEIHCRKHVCVEFDKVAHEVKENVYDNKGHDHPFYGGSSIQYTIKIKDRTPPHILTGLPIPPGDELPTLFADPMGPKAMTGDFTEIDALKVDDNYSDKVFCQFAFNRKLDPEDPPKWEIATGVAEVECKEEANHVFIPNDGLGEMDYSLFVWDEKDNGNPGLTSIAEHQPQDCYGLNTLGFRSLDWTDDFPLKFGAGISMCIGSDKFGKGKVIVDDNDWPNLVIQMVNKRDKGMPKSILCFPPPIVDPAQRPPTIDNDAGSVARLSPPDALISYEDLQFATAPAYIKILRAEGNNCPGDPTFGGFMNDPIDPVFLKKNFRLEAPDVSDNLPDGTQDKRPETMGQRMGYGNRMVLFCQESLIEDIEYEVHVWAEDNVKWIKDSTGRTIHTPYTGIQKLEVYVNDPKQRPPLRLKYDSAGETLDFWMKDPIRAVFREPVPGNPVRAAGETAWDANFPYVEAKAWDFKGNQRSLKVYFNVTDELSRIRVLEQKHQKN